MEQIYLQNPCLSLENRNKIPKTWNFECQSNFVIFDKFSLSKKINSAFFTISFAARFLTTFAIFRLIEKKIKLFFLQQKTKQRISHSTLSRNDREREKHFFFHIYPENKAKNLGYLKRRKKNSDRKTCELAHM